MSAQAAAFARVLGEAAAALGRRRTAPAAAQGAGQARPKAAAPAAAASAASAAALTALAAAARPLVAAAAAAAAAVAAAAADTAAAAAVPAEAAASRALPTAKRRRLQSGRLSYRSPSPAAGSPRGPPRRRAGLVGLPSKDERWGRWDALPLAHPDKPAGSVDCHLPSERALSEWRDWVLEGPAHRRCSPVDTVPLCSVAGVGAVPADYDPADCTAVTARSAAPTPAAGQLQGPVRAGDCVWYRSGACSPAQLPVRLGRVAAAHSGEAGSGPVVVERMVPNTLWWRLTADVGGAQRGLAEALPEDEDFWEDVKGHLRPADCERTLPLMRISLGNLEHLWWRRVARSAQGTAVRWSDERLDSLQWLLQGCGLRPAAAVRLLAFRWRCRGGRWAAERPAPLLGAAAGPREEGEAKAVARLCTDRPVLILVEDCPADAGVLAEARRAQQEGTACLLEVSSSTGWMRPHLTAALSELAQAAGELGGSFTAEGYWAAVVDRAGRVGLGCGSRSGPAERARAAVAVAAAARWAAATLSPKLRVPVLVLSGLSGRQSSLSPAWQGTAAQQPSAEGGAFAGSCFATRTTPGGSAAAVPTVLPALLAAAAHGGCANTALLCSGTCPPSGLFGDLHNLLARLGGQRGGGSALVQELQRRWRGLLLASAHAAPDHGGLAPTDRTLQLSLGDEDAFAYRALWSAVGEQWICSTGCRSRFPRRALLEEHRAAARHCIATAEHVAADAGVPQAPLQSARISGGRCGSYHCSVADGVLSFRGARTGELIVALRMASLSVTFAFTSTDCRFPAIVCKGTLSDRAGTGAVHCPLPVGRAARCTAGFRDMVRSHGSAAADAAVQRAAAADVAAVAPCSHTPAEPEAAALLELRLRRSDAGRALPLHQWGAAGDLLWEHHWKKALQAARRADALLLSLGLDPAAVGPEGQRAGFGPAHWAALGTAIGAAAARSRVVVLEGGSPRPEDGERLGEVIRAVAAGMQHARAAD
eukprot:TRINITY_DN10233_c0_g1_i1.p1 TRINITY_DN10233_c0_g1~~TRINITY_DN10233_c0_g1_i1.p1  ORF type:complete len:1017 (+),score=273.70 TRINITY_DN10233_c0_g1_i1:82-3051(+)